MVLPDNTRCDCVTDTHVIEFDFGQYPVKAVYPKLFYDLTIKLIRYLTKTNDLPIDTWAIGRAAFNKSR